MLYESQIVGGLDLPDILMVACPSFKNHVSPHKLQNVKGIKILTLQMKCVARSASTENIITSLLG